MRVWLSVVLMWLSSTALALYTKPVVGVGAVAQNITEPMEVASGFISVGCLVVGMGCLLAAIMKYFDHRRSPLYVPISTVIWLFIIALLLLFLPFCYMLTENGISFNMFWGGVR